MYNFYPEELIEEIRINNDIVDVISEYIKLEKKGANYFGLCPFHKEKSPSFCVSPTKQICSCFGCGKGGNVVHFVMNVENLDFIEAVRFLADRAKIQLPEGESKEEQDKAKLKKEIVKINTEAARFFHNNLNSKVNERAKQYILNRNISENTLRRFGLGYAIEEWDVLYKYLIEKQFDEEAILKSGLVLQGKNGGYYDRFRGRIMFPIFDVRGNIIGFGGRVKDDSLPKYMNSPETLVYNKGRNLYALNIAKNSGLKKLLVVEGYMDVISLHQSEIINTVASLGTALTESQGRILKKYADEIIISYDADTAGQAATMRGLDLLNAIGCMVKVLIVPNGKDPDEFIRNNGAEAFKSLIDKSLSLIEYKIKILKKQINTETTEGKISFLNKIADILVRVENSIEREMNLKKIAKEYGISEESLLSEIYRRIKPKNNFRNITVKQNENLKKVEKGSSELLKNKVIHDERMLLALVCIDNSVYKIIKKRVTASDLIDENNRQVAEIVFSRLENNKGIVPGELLNILDGHSANIYSRIIQEECNCEDNCKAALDILKRIELYKLNKRQQEILEILSKKSGLIEGDVEKLKLELNSIIIKKKSV